VKTLRHTIRILLRQQTSVAGVGDAQSRIVQVVARTVVRPILALRARRDLWITDSEPGTSERTDSNEKPSSGLCCHYHCEVCPSHVKMNVFYCVTRSSRKDLVNIWT
jgi:hypothetical protein